MIPLSMNFIDIASYVALVLGLYFLTVMIIAILKRDNGVIDIAYGGAFILTAWLLFFLWSTQSDRQLILVACVTVWGLRLTIRIFRRHFGKPEDFRYAKWREEWTEKGMLYFFLRSFLQIFLLQGLVVLIVALPLLVAFSSTQLPMTWLNWLGFFIWGIGFFFEVVGDWQLDRFVGKPENKGKLMVTGLWKYTRHPNYFGEATMWWGLFLVVYGLSISALTLASPLLITFLLTKVSGIPMLEKHWAGRSDWEVYKAKTSTFFPWFPKKETI